MANTKKFPQSGFAEIPIDSIKILIGRRIDEKLVAAIAKSIEREGLHYPITVYWRGGLWRAKYVVVAGVHRLLGTKLAGGSTIRVEIIDPEKADAWRNAENLLRNEPSALERAQGIADFARCILPNQTPPKGGEQPHDRNISRVARELGFGRRTVRNAFQIDALTERIKGLLVKSKLEDNESLLVKLSQLETETEQCSAISARIKSKSKPKKLEAAPATKDGNSTMPRSCQEAQRPAIDDWDADIDPPSENDALDQLNVSWLKSPTEALFRASSRKVQREFQKGLLP